jgi:hypothetical protein
LSHIEGSEEGKKKEKEKERERFGQFGDEGHCSPLLTALKLSPGFRHQMLENERGMDEAERQLKNQHRVYCSGRSAVEGTPARELEPTATHRLGLDIGS